MNTRNRFRILPIGQAIMVLIPLLAGASTSAAEPSFERDVLPILQRHCLGCHGGLRQKGELDLRTIPAMLKGGESGPAVKSGDLDHSEMWKKVSIDEMPNGNKKVPADEKDVLKRWIVAGLPVASQSKVDADLLLDSAAKHEPQQVASTIDRHIHAPLATDKIPLAKRSDDAEFLRRVYLDLIGCTPTAAQASAFLDSTDADKRAKLIDELLASPQFGEQFGRTWRDWICPPELPSDANGGKQPHNEAQNLGKWIAARVNAKEPWDKIVAQIVAVEGEIKSQPQLIFHGLVGEGGKITPDGSARAVASLFMGVQLQCAQCHDDPYRTWSQKEHWELAAFFSKTSGDFGKISEARNSQPTSIVIPKTAFLNSGKSIVAAIWNSDEKPASGQAPRAKLVDWLTAKHNPYFAKAFANRVWFYFFARGIVHPVDDLRELNPPSHPGLLKLLANEFTASRYDIRHLVRCVCLSEAYQRTSRVDPSLRDDDAKKQLAAFARMPLRVISADVLYDSLKLAYGDSRLDLRGFDPKAGNANGESAPVGDPYLEFSRRFCTNEDDATDFTHGIPQLLTMLNHPRLVAGSKSLDDYLKTKPLRPEIVEWLYLATLSRRPTSEEADEALAYLEKHGEDAAAPMGVLWMLVNRSEYLLKR